MSKKHLLEFLQDQKLLAIATVDGKGQPWVTNVYYSIDNDFNLFFVSPIDTKHSKHIAKKPRISFTVSWYHDNDLANRKAIQGVGVCEKIDNPGTIIRFLKNHHKYFPLWKDRVTHENMVNKVIQSRPYVIKPSYIKFWNDELYGAEGVQEFKF